MNNYNCKHLPQTNEQRLSYRRVVGLLGIIDVFASEPCHVETKQEQLLLKISLNQLSISGFGTSKFVQIIRLKIRILLYLTKLDIYRVRRISLSPMMCFGHVRDNHSCQILSVNGACSSLVICRAGIGQDHSRARRACIRGPPKDWRRTGRPRQILAENGWGWSAPAQLWPRDGKTARYGETGMASTRGCGYVLVTRSRERERERERENERMKCHSYKHQTKWDRPRDFFCECTV